MTILTVMLLAAAPAAGAEGQTQARPAATRQAEAAPAPAPVPPADERNARDTKERLREIFQQYPPSVHQVLRLDPSLLSRPDYLALYPTLANFLSQHPEVAHNPVFFLGGIGGGEQYSDTRGVANAVENIFVGLEVMIGVMFGIGTFAWLVRSAIDYRRWLRAMKIQTEAHTKIVDRHAGRGGLHAAGGRRAVQPHPLVGPGGRRPDDGRRGTVAREGRHHR